MAALLQPSNEPQKTNMPTGSLGVRERKLNYEAVCNRPTADAPPPPPTTSMKGAAAVERLRGRSTSGDGGGQARKRWTLASISEQRVLKAGVLCLRHELADNAANLTELPRRHDGTQLVMQGSFLRRLLAEEVELKVCSQCDVSMAQPDLRHLSTQQLLSMRAGTLDFSTDSDSHSAHRNFIFSLDTHLFEKLARQCLRTTSLGGLTPRPEMLRTLGVRMALVLGAIDVLAKGWNDNSAGENEDDAPLPTCWAIKLDENDWKGYSTAIFQSRELWLEVVPDESPNFPALASGGEVAVVTDRSVGSGIDRRLHWEIAALDPEADDVIAEINRKEGVELERLSHELSTVIRQRLASRMEVLGLAPTEPEVPVSPTPTPCTAGANTTPDRGKVAAAVLRINRSAPPGLVPSMFSTPERRQGSAPATPSGTAGSEPGTAGPEPEQAPPPELPPLEAPDAEAPPTAPAVCREEPVAAALMAGQVGEPPTTSPEPERPIDESDETQADSLLPCLCSRSAGKPNAFNHYSVIPECFKGIF